jgi:ABC-type dipeptide/oligopeptide/nickel transport system permease component
MTINNFKIIQVVLVLVIVALFLITLILIRLIPEKKTTQVQKQVVEPFLSEAEYETPEEQLELENSPRIARSI